ncbi:MAG: amidase [Dongiaceae bacterium]
MAGNLAFMGAVELGKRLARGSVSSVEATRAMLSRIEQLDPALKSYALVLADSALREARKADGELKKGRRRGPLHGVPLAVKDLCNMTGTPTGAGIPGFRGRAAKDDATVVKRLRDAGAVILGKLQLTEGALGLHHPDVPPPVNPWAAERWSGASSSGSGVATAAGLCYGSLGSDTGGSIRFPSLTNGLVGLKPTWGRVSRFGVFPLSETLDHIGPITRRVEDAAAMLTAIAGRDPSDSSSAAGPVPDCLAGIGRGVKGLRLGYDEAFCTKGVSAPVRKAVQRGIEALRGAGAELVKVKMPSVEGTAQAWMVICAVEAALAHEKTYPSRSKIYSAGFGGFLQSGREASGLDYGRAAILRRNFRGDLLALLGDVDMLISPVTPWTTQTVDEFHALCEDAPGLMELIKFTSIYDLAGTPTLSLPAGLDSNGAPLGFQLIGRPFDEALLCRAGKSCQDAAVWTEAVPPLAG